MLEVPVLGRRLAVRYVSDRELSQITKDSDCLGFFDSSTIYISSSLTQEHSKRVLLHELSHAILSITGLTNLLDDKQEEAICDAFESMTDVFKDEGMVKFLSSAEEN